MSKPTVRAWMSSRSTAAAGLEPSHGLPVDDVIADGYLDEDLVTMLGSLDDAPAGVADCAVQLLPLGSRSTLLALGIVRKVPASGAGETYELELTPFGYEVAHALVHGGDVDESAVRDWTDQANLAARAFEELGS